jgi:NAD(P)H-hydrate epimerase
MERAGTHAASLVARLVGRDPRVHPPEPASGARVVVLAGGGDNGGDARIVARCLVAWGHDVRLVETSADERTATLTRGRLTPESAASLSDDALASMLGSTDVVVDGMLGTGASGPLRGEVARVARILDRVTSSSAGRPLVVALDVPTGTDADTGAVVDHAVHAAVTVAFGWPKLGTLLHPARANAGRIIAVEIGFPPAGEGRVGEDDDAPATADGCPAFSWAALDAGWARSVLPFREMDAHKNVAGPVLIVAGSEGMAGAAVLAGRGALRSGAGYVRIASVASNRAVIQAALPEAVWVDRADPEALGAAIAASRAVVVGPGMGTDAAAADVLGRVLGARVPTVVDADALTLMAEGDGPWSGSGGGVAPRVLTPHPGEAARLLGVDTETVQADRLAALERLRQATGAVVLLKGRPSLVAGAHRRLDPSGSSDLATAGVGDVLAGTIGAQIARGAEPEEAACLGLWLTSAAARIAGRRDGLQATDLPDHLPAALAETRAGPRGETSQPWVTLDLPARGDGRPRGRR